MERKLGTGLAESAGAPGSRVASESHGCVDSPLGHHGLRTGVSGLSADG